jgi:hypothetical protein
MASSRKPEVVPLTGADCFLRAFDAEVRRTAARATCRSSSCGSDPASTSERLAAAWPSRAARSRCCARRCADRSVLPPVFRTDLASARRCRGSHDAEAGADAGDRPVEAVIQGA